MYADTGRLHLEVRDDGSGFDMGRAHDGIGLQNMRDRLGAVGGHVEITSQPGQGTLVAATAPFDDYVPSRPASSRDGNSAQSAAAHRLDRVEPA